jgi:hypothetical protein
MSATCPVGHLSATEDYCDQCGRKIVGALAPAAASTAAEPDLAPSHSAVPPAIEPEEEHDTARSPAREPCPNCGHPRSGDDHFCENCGHDLLAEPAVPARAVAEWEAIVSADRAYFDRYSNDALEFPEGYVEWHVTLSGDRVQIGRTQAGSGHSAPEIDLVGVRADPGISRAHAMLERQPDGTYAVVDLESMNGTMVNDDGKPIAPREPVGLADGDRVHVGAWTTLTIRRR